MDGKEVESVTTYGNNLTIPLPEGSNGKQVEVEVTATATEDGISGLWNSVRVGFLDMITMPESSWTLDDETRKIQENYLTIHPIRSASMLWPAILPPPCMTDVMA